MVLLPPPNSFACAHDKGGKPALTELQYKFDGGDFNLPLFTIRFFRTNIDIDKFLFYNGTGRFVWGNYYFIKQTMLKIYIKL